MYNSKHKFEQLINFFSLLFQSIQESEPIDNETEVLGPLLIERESMEPEPEIFEPVVILRESEEICNFNDNDKECSNVCQKHKEVIKSFLI